jgi:uncharacterized repeat protein (TIGR01451 family)
MKMHRISGRIAASAWLAGAMIMAAAGCQQTEEPKAAPAQAEQPAPVSGACKTYRPAAGAGWAVSQMAFPTGDANTSAVLLSTVTPAEVRVGESYTYQLHVTNLTNAQLQSVNVTASKASNLDVSASKPEGGKTSDGWTWNLGNLAPCETRVIEVTGKANEVGNSASCFAVSYNNLLCTAVRVVQPQLQVTKTAPAEVLICDPITMVFDVKNTGTGTASAVKLTDNLPAGLMTTDGQQSVTADVGDLGPGQAKRVTVQTKAAKTGTYNNVGSVAAAGNLTAQSNTTTTIVRQPVLTIACEAPQKVLLGRDATFAFTVKNTGDAPSNNTTLTLPLPAGTTFVSATEGGMSQGANASWNIGTLAAGATKTVGLTVKPSGIATFNTSATVQGACAAPVSSACAMTVEGIPAVLLEQVDLVDPVEVGGETTYVITVTNQGSAVLTNLKIVTELPNEEAYVSSAGVTTGSNDGKTVTFAALPSLAPKAKAEWRIVVKATGAADVRVRTLLTTDQFTRPLEKIESTNLYK